jgi:hypothetical protein
MRFNLLFLLGVLLFTFTSCGDDGPDESNLIHYDGDNNSSPILPAGNHEAAAFFPASFMATHEGRSIKTIEYFLFQLPTAASLVIYAEGNGNEPGDVLYEANLSVSGLREFQWNFHVLPNQLTLNGEAIWLSFTFAHASDQQTIGCDAGPADSRGGDWLYQSTDNNWTTFRQRSGDSINWNIRIELED